MTQRFMEIILPVEGMTCSGCELKIENAVRSIDGVKSVSASFGKAEIQVTYAADRTDPEKIRAAIESIGYRVQSSTGPASGQEDKLNVRQLLGAGVMILAVYLVVSNTVGFNFIPPVDSAMGYGMIFVIGMLTSLHCIAMCGGINLSQTVVTPKGVSQPRFTNLRPGLLYNGGRIVSYTLIGGLAGMLGAAISFTGPAKGVVAVASGILMIIMGLKMMDIFPWLKKINLRLPGFISRRIFAGGRNNGPVYVGLLNGLMPCGPLQAMQLYALGTGGFITGALSMLFFSLGTVPLVLGLGVVSTFLSRRFTNKMLKASMVLIVFLGMLMVGRGLNLSGAPVTLAAAGTETGNVARITDGVQLVTTSMESGVYTPIVVQKGIPVRWTIRADGQDLNGCNNPLTIPALNRQIKLLPGDNLIEFTPTEEGNLVYTCWMGMISSTITVVADVSQLSEQDLAGAAPISAAGSAGSCSCCSVRGE